MYKHVQHQTMPLSFTIKINKKIGRSHYPHNRYIIGQVYSTMKISYEESFQSKRKKKKNCNSICA